MLPARADPITQIGFPPNFPREPFGRLNEDTVAKQQTQDYNQTPAWAPVGHIVSTSWLGGGNNLPAPHTRFGPHSLNLILFHICS